MGAGRGVGVLACELGRRLAARFCWTKTTRTGTVLEPAAEDGCATCARVRPVFRPLHPPP